VHQVGGHLAQHAAHFAQGRVRLALAAEAGQFLAGEQPEGVQGGRILA
jgi:hypothetical protein